MFRFTTRDVLWLTVAVAMGLAWLADRQHLRREMAILEDKLQSRIEEKVQELATIEAIIRWPAPGENTIEAVSEVLEKRSLPKAVNLSR